MNGRPNFARYPGPGDMGYPYNDAEEARQEAIDERATELLGQYAKDDDKVLAAVEGVNTLGFDSLLDRAVRDFLMDWNAAGADDFYAVRDAALRLHERIWPHVLKQLRDDAESDAFGEQADFDARGDAA